MRFKKKKAFTLVELIIAIAVLAIISIPITNMVVTTVKMNKETEDKQQATFIGEEIVEKIKSVTDEEIINLNKVSLAGSSLAMGKVEGKVDWFNIYGEYKGFKVEGTFKPDESYVFVKTSETSKTPENYDVEIKMENGKIYLGDSNIYIPNTDEKLEIIIDNEKIRLNNYIDISSTSNKKIKVFLSNLENNLWDVIIKNNINEAFNIYIIKEDGTEGECTVDNIGGPMNIYSNIYSTKVVYNNSSRLYNINLKLSKNDYKYELNTSRKVDK